MPLLVNRSGHDRVRVNDTLQNLNIIRAQLLANMLICWRVALDVHSSSLPIDPQFSAGRYSTHSEQSEKTLLENIL